MRWFGFATDLLVVAAFFSLLFAFALVQPRISQSDYHPEKPEKRDWKGHLLCILESGGEHDMAPHKRAILDWTREIKSRAQVSSLSFVP